MSDDELEVRRQEAQLAADWASEVTGVNLRRLRKQLGWTYERLSRESGVTESTVWKACNPSVSSRITLETVARLAYALGCPLGKLIENPLKAEKEASYAVDRSHSDG